MKKNKNSNPPANDKHSSFFFFTAPSEVVEIERSVDKILEINKDKIDIKKIKDKNNILEIYKKIDSKNIETKYPKRYGKKILIWPGKKSEKKTDITHDGIDISLKPWELYPQPLVEKQIKKEERVEKDIPLDTKEKKGFFRKKTSEKKFSMLKTKREDKIQKTTAVKQSLPLPTIFSEKKAFVDKKKIVSKKKTEEMAEVETKKHETPISSKKFLIPIGKKKGEASKEKSMPSEQPLAEDLAEMKRKYKDHITFSNILVDKETPVEQTTEAEKQVVSYDQEKEEGVEVEEKPVRVHKQHLEEKKASLLGRKILSKKKSKDELPTREEEIDNVHFLTSGENLDAMEISVEEKQLIDKRISDASAVRDGNRDGEETKVEEMVLKTAEDNIESVETDKMFLPEKKTDISQTTEVIDEDERNEGVDVEHVFFDEIDTPHENKDLTLPNLEEPFFPSPSSTESIESLPESEFKPDDLTGSGEIELPKEVLQVRSVTLESLGFSEKEWEELDFYPLYEPFAYVEIMREKESLDKRYFLVEVKLSEEETHVLEFLRETIGRIDLNTEELEEKGEEKYFNEKVEKLMEEYNIKLDEESKKKVLYYLKKECLGLGKLEAIMKDPHIEDISCDGPGIPVFLYHRKYGSLKSNVEFENEEELSAFVVKLAQKCGKHISIAEPMLDATMPDGSRIQMTLSNEVTTKGSTFTIRKFREDPFSPPDLVEFNTMSAEMVAYMWMAVENGISALIAGGTAAGKTSTLNALSLFIPREAKIVSIEETREINLPHPNWIPGLARSGFGEVVNDKIVGEIDMFDLMKAALRQRPEYIIVGEIRGREAYVLFQAMATGHTTYSTVHADSAKSLIHRLEGKPINIPRIMLQALDIVCIQVTTRVKGKRVRRCKQIIEIIDIDPVTKEILTNEVFRWDPIEDKFIYSGKSYVL
ncbi:MAG: hypothetical protein DRN05_03860, partial [Thermoplasmata archaeon]